MQSSVLLRALTLTLLLTLPLTAQDKPTLSDIEKEMVKYLDSKRTELIEINQDIWTFAELGLQEFRSSARLIKVLEKNGFKVKKGISNMPTAFVAEYGSGKPIIGILAEYDALPDLAQEAGGASRKGIPGKENGHGCGHCALGTGTLGAALAIKNVYDTHKLKGTLRLYGTPAEETVIGKVYMTLDGQFDDLDACLHWHPGTKNYVKYSTSKAIISAKFTFKGLPAHASASPSKGRSALDGVELMNVGVNYMREHIKETSRIHYVITKGGGQPNVVPAETQVWYFIRANRHEDAEMQLDWIHDIAKGAAMMSRTKMSMTIDTDCHELIPNLPLSKIVERNFKKIGAPKFTKEEIRLAKELQAPLKADFSLLAEKALNDEYEPLPEKPHGATGGSTDVGDISWHVPTSGFGTASFPVGSPGHSWQNVAAIGCSIGHKGMMVAAKVMALSVVDMMQNPEVLAEAKKDLQARMKARKYTTRIPKGQKPPKTIR